MEEEILTGLTRLTKLGRGKEAGGILTELPNLPN
jgi:hypothetical protein